MPRYMDVREQELRFRQVHLDFHTSEHCPAVGADFDPDDFADTLKAAHVNSVTCFAKCHHGWSYHKTSVGRLHPHLSLELLPAMIEACHKRNINVPVYISVGWDELAAREHSSWREIKSDGTPDGASPLEAGWHKLCFNTPYLDYLVSYTEEVIRNYDIDGIFMDITWQGHCYCSRCLASMDEAGLDAKVPGDVEKFACQVLENYYKRLNAAVHTMKPGLRIFHNRGNIDKGCRDIAWYFSHWEIESLPTGGLGYDHFPISARYAAAVGMDFLGMTGKFHTSWGEFGGYKYPQALLYETNLTIALGGKCSVGDQLHPSGKIDHDTYRIIGEAYADVEKKEPWCTGAKPASEVAIFSLESEHNLAFNYKNPYGDVDAGAARMLLERQIMFDVIDRHNDFDPYLLIILPDDVLVNDELREKLTEFLKNGGSILSSGRSGLNTEGNAFMIDTGAEFAGESEWEQDYIEAGSLGGGIIPKSPMIMYKKAVNLKPVDCEVFSTIRPPYFNRDYNHFCSHRNTPYTTGDSQFPAAVRKGNVIHFAHRVFSAYRAMGQQYLRDIVINALYLLCPDLQVQVSMPSGGRISFMRQKTENRWILHLLYAVPIHRGENIEVIEDIVPLYNIPCSVALDTQPEKVWLAPSGENISFEWKNGRVVFTVPELYRHAMVIIEAS